MSERAYINGTLESYLDRLASVEPEPGGGSVAALVGALGAALVTMVTNLTLGKEKYAGVQDDMAALRAESETLRRRYDSHRKFECAAAVAAACDVLTAWPRV